MCCNATDVARAAGNPCAVSVLLALMPTQLSLLMLVPLHTTFCAHRHNRQLVTLLQLLFAVPALLALKVPFALVNHVVDQGRKHIWYHAHAW